MRGSIRKRGEDSWEVSLSAGFTIGADGKRRRRRLFETVRGTKRRAAARLAEMRTEVERRAYVTPSNVTVEQWLTRWLEAVRPTLRRRSAESYETVIRCHLVPTLGAVPLQHLDETAIEGYFAVKRRPAEPEGRPLSESTLAQHSAILHAALKAAKRSKLIQSNPAAEAAGKPKGRNRRSQNVVGNCWDDDEARRFLAAAREEGLDGEAFFTLALDSGARLGELTGLKWSDLDWNRGKLTIARQLLKPARRLPDVDDPPKGGEPRTIDLATGTLALLRRHLEAKMAAGVGHKRDDPIFTRPTGEPLARNNIGERMLAPLVARAGLKRITFHGLRHTCATLLLKAGVPLKVVSERLGHRDVTITLETYAHVLGTMQRDAAERMQGILF